jgi:hypothetical protein
VIEQQAKVQASKEAHTTRIHRLPTAWHSKRTLQSPRIFEPSTSRSLLAVKKKALPSLAWPLDMLSENGSRLSPGVTPIFFYFYFFFFGAAPRRAAVASTACTFSEGLKQIGDNNA